LQSAFIGWQIQEIVKGALNEKPTAQRFSDYASQLGLLGDEATADKPIQPKKSAKQEAADAIAKAERIRKADQEQQKRKGTT
jgi:hypothetical protein